MFRFTIRDLLWLMVVVGMGAWQALSARRIANLEAGLRNLYAHVDAMDEIYKREIQVIGAATEFQRGLSGGTFTPLPSPPVEQPATLSRP